MPIKLTFVKDEQGEGSRELGTLSWGSSKYNVITGGYGKGALPDGDYTVEVRKAVVGDSTTMASGFVNPANDRGWILPLTPLFTTARGGFGIHPDGNKPGTKGCVGLQGADIKLFWDKWLRTSMANRPVTLTVSTQTPQG